MVSAVLFRRCRGGEKTKKNEASTPRWEKGTELEELRKLFPPLGHPMQKYVTDLYKGGIAQYALGPGYPLRKPLLEVAFADVYRSSFNPHKTLMVRLWIPGYGFVWVAAISTCRNPDAWEFVKAYVLKDTPIYRPEAGFDNYIYPGHRTDTDPIHVERTGTVVEAGLLRGFGISLPFPRMDLSFNLDPFELRFEGVGATFGEQDTTSLPSGYTILTHCMSKTATVSLLPPSAEGACAFGAKVQMDASRTFIPP
jgi:hypothetical protein